MREADHGGTGMAPSGVRGGAAVAMGFTDDFIWNQPCIHYESRNNPTIQYLALESHSRYPLLGWQGVGGCQNIQTVPGPSQGSA